MKGFLRAGVLGIVTCLGMVFPAKEAQEKFVFCVKPIVLFNSLDRGPHDTSISSFIKNILQNDTHVITDDLVEDISLFQKEYGKVAKKSVMNFATKDHREQWFLNLKEALDYIGKYIQNHEEVLRKRGKIQFSETMSLKALKNDVCALEQFYIKGQKDRMRSEFLADLYALFEFFYRYPRGESLISGDFRYPLSFKSCEGMFEVFLFWIYTMFSYDMARKNPFWSDKNKKLFEESIENFKKPGNYCKKENLFLLRKNFCEALFHIPYHVERYENLLRGDGQTKEQYFLTLRQIKYFALEIKKKFVSFFPVKSF